MCLGTQFLSSEGKIRVAGHGLRFKSVPLVKKPVAL